MYDVTSSDHSPVSHMMYPYHMILYISILKVYVFEGMSKNVTSVGFYQNGNFMYSGGEDSMARIWDLRYVINYIRIMH